MEKYLYAIANYIMVFFLQIGIFGNDMSEMKAEVKQQNKDFKTAIFQHSDQIHELKGVIKSIKVQNNELKKMIMQLLQQSPQSAHGNDWNV